MKKETELVKNTLILAIGTWFPKAASFITLPILTLSLTKEEYGMYDLVLVMITMLSPLCTLQIHRAAFRYLINCKDDDERKCIISTAYLGIAPIIISVMIFIFLLQSKIDIHTRILIVLYIFIEIIMEMTMFIARGLKYNKTYSLGAGISSFFYVFLILIAFIYSKVTFIIVFVSNIIARGITLIFLFHKIRIRKFLSRRFIKKVTLLNMLKYSLPFILSSLSLWVINVSDRVIITICLGLEQSAVYAVANKIPSLIGNMYTSFNMAWQESASEAEKDDDSKMYYSSIFQKLYDFMIGVVAVLIAITPILFKVLINSSYNMAYYQMPILFLGIFFSCFSSFYGGIYVALMQTNRLGISTIMGAIINVIINLLLIDKIGIFAASVSTLISYQLVLFYRMKDIQKIRPIEYNKKRIMITGSIIIFMCIVAFKNVFWGHVINLLVGIIFAGVVNRGLIQMIIKNGKRI